MSSVPEFIARRVSSRIYPGGFYWSLRLRPIHPTSHFEWAQLAWINGEWRAWGDDEDMGRVLRASLYDVRRGTLEQALAACRTAYMRYWHTETPPTELDDENAAMSAEEARHDYELRMEGHFDATGPGQDWDANHGFDC
jgi:hypothetical protein